MQPCPYCGKKTLGGADTRGHIQVCTSGPIPALEKELRETKTELGQLKKFVFKKAVGM